LDTAVTHPILQDPNPKVIPPNWNETEPANPQLPLRIQKLMRQGQIPDYTKEYQTATHMVQALYKSQPANEIMQRQIYT